MYLALIQQGVSPGVTLCLGTRQQNPLILPQPSVILGIPKPPEKVTSDGLNAKDAKAVSLIFLLFALFNDTVSKLIIGARR